MLRRVSLVVALVASSLAIAASPASAATSFSVWNLFAGSSLSPVLVDVCVDGTLVADGIDGENVAGPVNASGTSIALTVFIDSADPDCSREDSPLIDDTTTVADGGILVLHNGANEVGGAQPEYTWLPAVTCIAAGQGRITLVHAANAPAVDVAVGGTNVVEGLTNGQAASLDLPGGTVLDDVAVKLAGTSTVVLSGSEGTVEAGRERVVAVFGGVGGSVETRVFGVERTARVLAACQVSTSSTSTTTSTTTGTAAVTATPSFTG